MFGFLAPQQPEPTWRRTYARICQVQNRLFGIKSLPFLSYEATFLYQLAIDFELTSPLPDHAPTCCRMRKITRTALGQHGNREQRIESTSTTKGFRSDQLEDPLTPVICAAFGLVLAGVKLRDDVQDSGRWPSRLFWWMYRRRVTQAEELMEAKLPGLMQSVEECIRMHRQMETSSTRVPLDDFTWPTGKGFAEVFRRTAQLIARLDGTERYVQTFEQIGRLIGESIIAWDCAVDFDNDRIKGNFNPLCDESDRVRAFQLCHLRLAQIGWLCPADSVSGRVIRNVMNRVERRITNPSPVCTPSLLERWGLIDRRLCLRSLRWLRSAVLLW